MLPYSGFEDMIATFNLYKKILARDSSFSCKGGCVLHSKGLGFTISIALQKIFHSLRLHAVLKSALFHFYCFCL